MSNPASVTGPYALPVCSGPHHIPICTAAAHMPMCTTQPTWSLPGACNFAGIPACGIQHLPSCGLAQVSKTEGDRKDFRFLMMDLHWSERESESDVAWNGYIHFLVVCLHWLA